MSLSVYWAVEPLAVEVRHRVASAAKRLVAIDGFDGSGKSTLASALTPLLDATHVRIDNYLTRQQGTYLAHLRYQELAPALQGLLAEDRAVLLEGVCIQLVLRTLGVVPTATIYVKRISSAGLWHDGYAVEDYEEATSPDQRATLLANPSRLRDEVLAYHAIERPHLRSDLVYERVEGEDG